MKKIILFGVYALETRRAVEFFLDKEEYDIIAYSDSCYEFDVLDGKRFVSPKDLILFDFDYVVICALESYESIVRNLNAYGVSCDKIIVPALLRYLHNAKYQIDAVKRIDIFSGSVDGLLFGLSYSKRGMIEEYIDCNYYDFSGPGFDLYYNYKLYKYAIGNMRIPEHCSVAIMCFPYMYFDYDMSLSLAQYESGQMMQIVKLDDWHNAWSIPEAIKHIEMFRMFGKRMMEFYRMDNYSYVNYSVMHKKDGLYDLDRVWFSCREKTYNENLSVMKEFINELNASCIIILVPPFYIDGLSDISKKAFYEKKDRFYSTFDQYFSGINVRIEDCSALYDDRRLFDSYDHLNYYGAIEFSKYVNELLKQ